MRRFYLLCLSLLLLVITSCSTTPGDPNSMICRELRSEIILNGATTNVNQIETERAASQLQQKNYHQLGCDERMFPSASESIIG